MISVTTLLIAAVGAAVFYFFFKKEDKNMNYPPGPRGWPLVGNMLDAQGHIHLKAAEWVRKYGDVVQIWFGPKRAILISDPKLIREAFNDHNYSGKPEMEAVNLITDGPRGLLNSTGKEWEEQRRFTLRHLRDFGFGKNALESTIMEEVNQLLTSFKSQEGQSLDVSRRFSLSILNTMWHILASKTYKLDDPTLSKILNLNAKHMDFLMERPFLLLADLAKLAPGLSGWTKLQSLVGEIQKFIKDSAEEHKASFVENGEHRDFLDAYIHEMKETKDPNSSFYGQMGEKNLLAVTYDLFAAGSETTSTTLNYTLLLLSKFPQYQKKVQEELDTVVGRNRQPTFEDKPNLPFCTAVMEEVLRYHCLVPLGSIRKTFADTKLGGYDIPKGSFVTANFHWIHYNEKYFPNAHQFDPHRFLTEDGKTFKKNENMMSFSLGKRECLGQILARQEYYLFFTSIFQKFEIELAPNYKNVDITLRPGPVLKPPTFEVVMRDRLNE